MVLAVLTIVEIIMIQREITSRSREKLYIKSRINGLNDLYNNIIFDSKKSLNIIGKRAISIASSHVIQDGIPLSNSNETIKDLMVYGKFNETQDPLMEGSRISDWIEKMVEISLMKGYQLNLKIENVTVKPYDSFNLIIEADTVVNITDPRIASINREEHVETLVSIEGIEDPLYPLNTNGMITQKIQKTPYENNFTQFFEGSSGGNGWIRGISFVVDEPSSAESYPNKSKSILLIEDPKILDLSSINEYMGLVSIYQPENETEIPYVFGVSNINSFPNNTYILVDGEGGKVWYIENFINHLNMGYYKNSSSGPSFLDRLEGKLYIQSKYLSQAENIGLESFVNKTNFILHKIDVEKEKTNIDYLYFSNSSYPGKEVTGVDGYFRIDENHAEIYGVDQLID